MDKGLRFLIIVALVVGLLASVLFATPALAGPPPTRTVHVPAAVGVGAANANFHQDAVDLVPAAP